MENDKIYTCLSADMLKRGSRGYFADDLETLKKLVDSGENTHLLMQVNSRNATARFKTETEQSYCLFYLVSVPPEPYTRPYKSGDELLLDFENRKHPLYVINDETGMIVMITALEQDGAWLNGAKVEFTRLHKYFHFKNGDTVGVLENAE